MRVVVVPAWPPWPPDDGARLVLHHHLAHLRARHDVTVLSPPATTSYLRRRALGLLTAEPADVYRVVTRPLLDELARVGRPDVVHLHGWGTAALVRRVEAPCVHTAIDAWSEAVHEVRALPRWRRVLELTEPPLIRAHERRHYPSMAAVVVVTDEEADAVRRVAPGTNVVVIPNGVEAGPEPGPPADERVLAFHGNLSTVANVDAAVHLARDVLPAVPAARLLLIGRDPAPAVRALAGPSVEVTGEVPDVRDALSRAAVFVAPMRRGTGIKNKVLEAMAAGLPVVATTRALHGIGAARGIRVADDVDAMAAHVVELLGDADLCAREGQAARRRVVADHTWDAAADRLDAVWRDAAAR